MDGPYLGLRLYADSCYMIAISPAELRNMARAWKELMQQAGLLLAWQEAVWCCSATDGLEPQSSVADVENTRRKRRRRFSRHWEYRVIGGIIGPLAQKDLIQREFCPLTVAKVQKGGFHGCQRLSKSRLRAMTTIH